MTNGKDSKFTSPEDQRQFEHGMIRILREQIVSFEGVDARVVLHDQGQSKPHREVSLQEKDACVLIQV